MSSELVQQMREMAAKARELARKDKPMVNEAEIGNEVRTYTRHQLHEMKTALGAAHMACEVLVTAKVFSEADKTYLGMIERNIDKVTELLGVEYELSCNHDFGILLGNRPCFGRISYASIVPSGILRVIWLITFQGRAFSILSS